jgi:hypothetical protein
MLSGPILVDSSQFLWTILHGGLEYYISFLKPGFSDDPRNRKAFRYFCPLLSFAGVVSARI